MSAKLEAGAVGTPSISPAALDNYLKSHLIDPALLRADDFDGFMRDRQKRLLNLIESATGQAILQGEEVTETEAEVDEETAEAERTIAA